MTGREKKIPTKKKSHFEHLKKKKTGKNMQITEIKTNEENKNVFLMRKHIPNTLIHSHNEM